MSGRAARRTVRRVGAETSETRSRLLDAIEALMLDDGYASVTYRKVAAKADVTAALVQYYFPTLDDLFIALLRRRSERNFERLVESLAARPDEPLRVIWEYSSDETNAALMMEFMALANHRKSLRAEIAEVTERARRAQFEAVDAAWRSEQHLEVATPAALLFVLAGLPKLLLMEEALGTSFVHAETLELVEQFLERNEPRAVEGSRPATA